MTISFRLYREYGALNSSAVFDAMEQGIVATGNRVISTDADISVIWSVMWSGRMAGNREIYRRAILENKPILIIEVGNLHRGITWRVGLTNVNNDGYFGNNVDLNPSRPKQLGLTLEDNLTTNSSILIVGQHTSSLQWQHQPTMQVWIDNTVSAIRQYSDRQLVFRPHPRDNTPITIPAGVSFETPHKIASSYDSYDIDYNYHCVVNHNSGPSVQSAIHGTPVVSDMSSLAYPVSDAISNIEYASLPDRTDWFLRVCHTEWTIAEIQRGIPLARLLPLISSI